MGLFDIFKKKPSGAEEAAERESRNFLDEEGFTDVERSTVELRARVAELICRTRMIGSKNPKAIKEFAVVFEADDGKIHTFGVPEEMYDCFEKGQIGTVSVVDGVLYGFALDEGVLPSQN